MAFPLQEIRTTRPNTHSCLQIRSKHRREFIDRWSIFARKAKIYILMIQLPYLLYIQ
jgi:hypothetical protein